MIHERITALVENAKSFGEKTRQISPSRMEAFGITISSRYGRFYELLELLLFAEAAAEAAVGHYVREAVYDSPSNTCMFELDRSVVLGSEIEKEIHSCVHNFVRQYLWFGQCYGLPLGDSD